MVAEGISTTTVSQLDAEKSKSMVVDGIRAWADERDKEVKRLQAIIKSARDFADFFERKE